MRMGLLGDTGSGKTVTGVDLIKEYYGLGYNIYSNIKLYNIEFEWIKDTSFIESIDNTEKNFVFVDEVGEISTGFYQFNFGQLMAQSRKSIGEDQIFCLTAQVRQQANSRIWGMVDYLFYPVILTRDKDSGKPVHVKIMVKRKIPFLDKPVFVFDRKKTMYRNVFYSCELYDTLEMVEPIRDGKEKKYLKKYSMYIGSDGELQNLKTLLHKKEGLNKSEADMIAREIIYANEWGNFDETKIRKKDA